MDDTRIIKLPSRTSSPTPVDNRPAADKYKDLARSALPVDVELSSVIAAWATLPQSIKDNILTLICIRQ